MEDDRDWINKRDSPHEQKYEAKLNKVEVFLLVVKRGTQSSQVKVL